MNVYDFDKTIYHGDSSVDFYKYCLRRFPKISKFWPKQAKAMKDYKSGKISKTEMKTIFYEYFTLVPDINAVVLDFWNKHDHKIKDWYLEVKESDDLIISASPVFLLEPICKTLNVELIASVVDPKTGRNLRENCWGQEKVLRMKEHYDIHQMDRFFSDSYSDDPLAQFAKEAFMVKGNEIKAW